MKAAEYMCELIPYGDKLVPRGYAYALLMKVAKNAGYPKPRLMADRWMQGYDLHCKLKKQAQP